MVQAPVFWCISQAGSSVVDIVPPTCLESVLIVAASRISNISKHIFDYYQITDINIDLIFLMSSCMRFGHKNDSTKLR